MCKNIIHPILKLALLIFPIMLSAQITNKGTLTIIADSEVTFSDHFTNETDATVTNNGLLNFKKDFTNPGTYTIGTGKAFFNGEEDQNIYGSISFYQFETSNGNRTLGFLEESITTILAGGELKLAGDSDNNILIRTIDSSGDVLDPGGSTETTKQATINSIDGVSVITLDYVDIKDNILQDNGTPDQWVTFTDRYHVDSGNNNKWFLPGYEIEGYVFYDQDASGILNGAETGLQDVEVSLYDDSTGANPNNGVYDGDEAKIKDDATTIAATGWYEFIGIGEGTYFLKVNDADDALNNDANNGSLTYGATSDKVIKVTIVDEPILDQNFGFNDAKVTFSANTTNLLEANESSNDVEITAQISLKTAFETNVSLAYTGTALAADYTQPATITINANELTGSIILNGIQDADVEGDETISVDIDTIDNATETETQQVNLTLIDDDISVAATGTEIFAEAGNVIADDVISKTIQVQLKDNSGRNLGFAGVNVSFFSSSTNAVLSSATAVTNENGVATITVSNTTAETINITATVDQDRDGGTTAELAIVDGSPIEITFVTSGIISVVDIATEILGTDLTRVADGIENSTFTVQLKDKFGNLISTPDVPVQFTSTIGDFPAEGLTTTDNTGFATITLNSKVAGEASVTAMVDTDEDNEPEGSITNGSPIAVTFEPGAKDDGADGTLLYTSKEEPIADGVDFSTLYVQLKDIYNNSIPEAGVAVKFSTTFGTLSTTDEVFTNAEGIAEVTIQATDYGTATINAVFDINNVNTADTPVTNGANLRIAFQQAPDSDNDGLIDVLDPNDTNIDTDGDCILDGADVDVDGDGNNDNGNDTDGDGIRDFVDVDMDTEPIDSDNDGVKNYRDPIDDTLDDDKDGLPNDLDPDSGNPDTDGDGIPDGADADANGDGTIDNGLDTDSDGILNCADADVDGDGINENGEDEDGDGIADDKDTIDNNIDEDEDGLAAAIDPDDNNPDIDQDCILDGKDVDIDGNGAVDNGTDSDADGINDFNDTVDDLVDSDGDSVPDDEEIATNSDHLSSSSFIDTDADEVPDYIELKSCPATDPEDASSFTDTDGDGVPDYVEENSDPASDPNDGTDYPDTDGDGVPDYIETHGTPATDPTDATDFTDTDGDGVPDYIEEYRDNTDPTNPDDSKDSDGDGVPDYVEENSDPASNPNDGTDYPDTDGDGVPDYIETRSSPPTDPNDKNSALDSDGDGIPDYVEEYTYNSDPNNADDNTDTDGDGVPDYVEENSNPPTDPNDSTDYIDSDNDGVPDYVEMNTEPYTDPFDKNSFVDTDGDGVPDYTETYTNNTDPNDPTDFTDADGDGVPDYIEVNSDPPTDPNDANSFNDRDNDGVPDYTESNDTTREIYVENELITVGHPDAFLTINKLEKYPNNTVYIYNRSGRLVFEAQGYDNKTNVFHGNQQNSNEALPTGVYYYRVTYESESEIKTVKGFVYLSN